MSGKYPPCYACGNAHQPGQKGVQCFYPLANHPDVNRDTLKQFWETPQGKAYRRLRQGKYEGLAKDERLNDDRTAFISLEPNVDFGDVVRVLYPNYRPHQRRRERQSNNNGPPLSYSHH